MFSRPRRVPARDRVRELLILVIGPTERLRGSMTTSGSEDGAQLEGARPRRPRHQDIGHALPEAHRRGAERGTRTSSRSPANVIDASASLDRERARSRARCRSPVKTRRAFSRG